MKHIVFFLLILSLSACADVSDLPITELPHQIKKIFKAEDDGRTDIVTCLQNRGDIVLDEATRQARCRELSGELIELRDLR